MMALTRTCRRFSPVSRWVISKAHLIGLCALQNVPFHTVGQVLSILLLHSNAVLWKNIINLHIITAPFPKGLDVWVSATAGVTVSHSVILKAQTRFLCSSVWTMHRPGTDMKMKNTSFDGPTGVEHMVVQSLQRKGRVLPVPEGIQGIFVPTHSSVSLCLAYFVGPEDFCFYLCFFQVM